MKKCELIGNLFFTFEIKYEVAVKVLWLMHSLLVGLRSRNCDISAKLDSGDWYFQTLNLGYTLRNAIVMCTKPGHRQRNVILAYDSVLSSLYFHSIKQILQKLLRSNRLFAYVCVWHTVFHVRRSSYTLTTVLNLTWCPYRLIYLRQHSHRNIWQYFDQCL